MRLVACVLGLVVVFPAPHTVSAEPQAQGMQSVIIREGQQQPEKTGTARLAGRVTAADTGRPLRRVVVRAMSPETPQGRSVSTDAEGNWELRTLPAARYTLQFSKGGYVNLSYGQRRPFEAGTGLEVADGQVIDKLDVSLPRAGVITGTVVDEFGDPVSGARVMAMRNRYIAGQRRLTGMGQGDMTDDIGQYRLHGLPPGDYYVSATIMGGLMFGQSDDRTGYAATFYPGTAVQGEAQRVSVAEGQEAPQVNIAMAVTRVATLSGTAFSSSGKPISRGMLSLITVNAGGMQTGFSTMIQPDGSFTHSNVAPGEYRLQVQHVPNMDSLAAAGGIAGMAATESASMTLTVTGEDITGIALVASPAAVATGRIRFEGGGKPATPAASVNIIAPPLEMGTMMMGGMGRVRDDWTFEINGLTDRRRFRVPTPPPGWYLKAVTYEGEDITDSGMEFRGEPVSGIEIVLTQRATELSGSVQDSGGRPVTDYVIVAFSPDSEKWGFQSRFVRMMRPNQDGRFSIKDLPPGDYLAVALEYLEPGEEGDPEQLEKWRASATPARLEEGESKVLTLRLTP